MTSLEWTVAPLSKIQWQVEFKTFFSWQEDTKISLFRQVIYFYFFWHKEVTSFFLLSYEFFIKLDVRLVTVRVRIHTVTQMISTFPPLWHEELTTPLNPI